MTMATILAMTTIDQLQVKGHVSMKLPHMKIYIEFFFFLPFIYFTSRHFDFIFSICPAPRPIFYIK